MAKQLNKDAVYRASKPKEKEYTINDGDGLVLLIKPNGAKLWRFIYRFGGKQNRISFGAYPSVTTQHARIKADQARELLSNEKDPAAEKKQEKQLQNVDEVNAKRKAEGLPIKNSFADITAQWLASIEHLTKPQTHFKKISRIERLAFPVLGDILINKVRSSDILAALKPLIDKMQLETAHRLHSEISSIFAYAIVHNFTDYDPAQPVAKQIPAQKVKHRAAIIEPQQVGQLLRDIYNYKGTFIVQMAFRLTPLLFQRPSEIRQLLWEDVDLDTKEWRPYISKTDYHHIVPLSTQAIEIIEAIKPLTGGGNFVFPSSRGKGRPMSDNTIRTALKSLGYESDIHTAHGFRTTASTLLNEQGWSPDAIERQLAHAPRDKVRAAYNRAQYLEERRRMMQSWSDYLDSLKNGAQILEFKKIG